jgi:hypothetical protein
MQPPQNATAAAVVFTSMLVVNAAAAECYRRGGNASKHYILYIV